MFLAVWSLAAIGAVAIICFEVSTSGNRLAHIGAGVLTAFAAGLSGAFFGFLLGVPRAVSSGTARREAGTDGQSTNPLPTVVPGGAAIPAPAESGVVARGVRSRHSAAEFVQSTNLAEISDWLTKLLLGAGLVSLTKLGAPLGSLFRTVASDLSSTPDDVALLMAGAIVVTYVALGFMATYVATSIWYTKLLQFE